MQYPFAWNVIDKPNGSISAGDIIIDLINKRVRRSGRLIRLTPGEFLLLEYLVRNKNKVVSREEIACDVWGRSYTNKVERVPAFMNSLRKKLQQDNGRNYIYTIIRKGYLFTEKFL
jgi:two-component system copper resistance phosphate regulon response regulator CusR